MTMSASSLPLAALASLRNRLRSIGRVDDFSFGAESRREKQCSARRWDVKTVIKRRRRRRSPADDDKARRLFAFCPCNRQSFGRFCVPVSSSRRHLLPVMDSAVSRAFPCGERWMIQGRCQAAAEGGGGGRDSIDSLFFFFFDRPRCFARRDGRTSRRLLLLLDREEGTLFCALEQAPRRFDERREARCGKKREIIIARDWKKSRRRRRRPLLPPSLTLSTCPPLSHKNLSLSLSLLSPGQNIRKLVKDGFILKKPSKIHSRSRARSAAEAKAKGRHTGYGKRRG